MWWYAVVAFGSPTEYTIHALGHPSAGRRVSRDIERCRARVRALRGHVCTVRIVRCRTRREARAADISGRHQVVSS